MHTRPAEYLWINMKPIHKLGEASRLMIFLLLLVTMLAGEDSKVMPQGGTRRGAGSRTEIEVVQLNAFLGHAVEMGCRVIRTKRSDVQSLSLCLSLRGGPLANAAS